MSATFKPRRILVVGSGGREHALAWRLSQDPEPAELIAAPGNDGIAALARCVPVAAHDVAGLRDLAVAERVDLVVVGPEAPLAAGLADACAAAGVAVFGPTREAAQLESSKQFAKQRMQALGMATPRSEQHSRVADVAAALDRFAPPYVVKADGLAAGKGVCVAASRDAALAFARDALERDRFGEAGRCVLIEAFVTGEERTVMAVCDGERGVLLPTARDAKRAFDGDAGPNTGGMGAWAPADDTALERDVAQRIIEPLLADFARRGTPFRGVLYAGLMLTVDGPVVLEFNVRFGDPETEAVLPLVGGTFGTLLASAACGALDRATIARRSGAAIAVALVDDAYPESARSGGAIAGLDAIASQDVRVFTSSGRREDGAWRLAGGRAAYVGASGDDLAQARTRAYDAIARLGGSGWRCRRDIGAPHDDARGSLGPGAATLAGSN